MKLRFVLLVFFICSASALRSPADAASPASSVPAQTPAQPPVYRPPVSSFQIPKQITFCGEPVPLDREDVRERLEREFYYLLDREGQLLLYIKRAGRTDPVVVPLLKREGVPEDLKYVPVAESGLLFRSRSPAGAVGYWQFMKETATQNGLLVDSWVDERRSLPLSTVAAAKHLKDLREELGSWTMALAAYNGGRRRLIDAVREQGTRNYYDLYLPEETERYVFSIIVLKRILEDPAAYSIIVPKNAAYLPESTATVRISNKAVVTMDMLSTCAKTPPRSLRHMNPWMLRNELQPGDYAFEVPKGKEGLFGKCVEAKLANIRELVHIVKPGEFLNGIAEEYGVTVRQIEEWNGISRRKPVHPGQRLIIQVGE